MPRTSDAFFGGLARVRGSNRTRYSSEQINWLTDHPRLCSWESREGVIIRSVDHRISFQTIRKRILRGRIIGEYRVIGSMIFTDRLLRSRILACFFLLVFFE